MRRNWNDFKGGTGPIGESSRRNGIPARARQRAGFLASYVRSRAAAHAVAGGSRTAPARRRTA